MEQKRIPRPGQIYRHFKNRLYQIITVATHSETGEKMVVYQALYGNFKTYVRPLSMFISEVDAGLYPDAGQKYRFELVLTGEEEEFPTRSSAAEQKEAAQEQKEVLQEQKETLQEEKDLQKTEINVPEPDQTRKLRTEALGTGVLEETVSNEETGSINPVLLEFLEADTYDEKLGILLNKKKYINDKVLNDMAVSIDCTLDDGEIEDRISEFAYCLQTHARFESKRLR